MKIITTICLILIILVFLQIKIFSQVAPGDSNAVKVEFRFYHELASTDSGVGLNGSFNNWTGGVFKMEEREPNWWYVTLDLLTIGYEYKFVTYTDTVGQAGVTGYFTDPLNPRSGGPFNNSIITIKSPMIYYIIPKNGTNIFDDRPILTTNIGFKNSTSIDVNRTRFWLDGNEIQDAGSYYNSTTKRFTYQPTQGLSYTQHTAILRVFNTEGDSATDSTKFTLQSFFSIGKFTFKFDSKSPTFDFPGDITRVDAKGDFNSQGSTPMNDFDGDGIYTLTTDLEVNLENEYTIIVNSGLYINDPDNPDLSSNYKTYVIKRLQSYPYFLGFNTTSGQTFEYPASPIVISTVIMRSDSLVSISQPSLTAKLNGVTVPITTTNLGGNYEIKATLSNLSSGRYVLEFFGNDFKGYPAKPIKFVFGIYPDGEGYHFVDNDEDDDGIGTFVYPSNILGGCADIKEVVITSVPTLDSLKIDVHLDSISQNTRIGFFIGNNLNGEYVLAPQDANIKIPEWHEKGVYFTIAPLFSSFFNPTDENIVYVARDPMQTSHSFSIDTTNISDGKISFKIPLTVLEAIMGTYRSEWYCGAYTFLKDQNGTIKIDETLGGTDSDESPNIYDVTFTGENINQARTINNFISISGIGGPRITKIGSFGRGSFKVHPSQINSQLGLAPAIRLLTIGGEIRTDSIVVYGFAEAPANTEVTFHTTQYDTTLTTNNDSLFFIKIKLNEGENLLSASMVYNTTLLSHSPSIVFNRIVNHNPIININTDISGGLVTMNADSSYDPDGGNLTFLWEQDLNNPKIVVLNGSLTSTASFNSPVETGEYYFTLKATSLSGREGWARTVVSVTDTGTHIPDMRYWHPAWVDTQIVYSIFVRAFNESGNFTEITNRIPQLKELGINTIWLLPVHPTTNNIGPDNPGYAITDYYGLYENYGTSVDFKNMINTAHQYGIKTIMDHVIQHTSILHPFMKDANVNKQYSPYYPFYMWDANNNFQYLFTWVDLPSINYEEESTRNYLLDMANYWIHDFNIDGFRCDVAWAINDLRTSGPAYWKSFRSKLKKTKPDVFLLAEADAEYPRYFDEKFDAAYDWSWFNNVKSIFGGSGSIDSLSAAIEYYFNPSFPENARPFKFTENQDEQRFIEAYGLSASKLASTLLFSSPGIPMLYAGQEVGEFSFRGIINWNDPYNLRPFYKKLTRMRHDNSSLSKGDYTRILNSTPTSVLSFLRTHENNDVITICNFNSSQVTTTLQVPIEKLSFDSTASFYLNDIVNNQYFSVVGSQLRNYTITTPAVTARVLVLSDTPLDIEENSEEIIPIEYSISQNYPNPFNPSTRINYSLPFPSKVKISIFNILGEKIADLINGEMNAGYHDIQFNASTLASGVYFYFIEAKSLTDNQVFQKASKMILLK